MLIKLDNRNPAHQNFSYELQKERYKNQDINIEGFGLPKCPTFSEHLSFLERNQYRCYYIYMENFTYVGVIYIKDEHEICIFIQKRFWGKRYGEKCLEAFLKRLEAVGEQICTATVNVNNRPSNHLFSRLGFKHVANVYSKNL